MEYLSILLLDIPVRVILKKQMKQGQLNPMQLISSKSIKLNWHEFHDNSCKGEDMWGHYKTANGDLYVVADGVSNHDGSKTGGDVVDFIDKRLKQEAANIIRSHHLKKLIYSINTESAKLNEGAYAAIAGILYRENRVFSFSAGDVSVIAKKPNGKLIRLLPLDTGMQREIAELSAKSEIGKIIDNILITKLNYKKRINQYLSHGLSNAIGIGKTFNLHCKSFNAREGAAILIATDGITDPFINAHIAAGKMSRDDARGIYDVLNSNKNAKDAAEALHNLIWDTQVKEKKKIKADDRTGIFIYMENDD